jgi:isopentenyl-diphosphate delta-isomerase
LAGVLHRHEIGDMPDIQKRKEEHLDIVLSEDVGTRTCTTGLEAVRFEHRALPELKLEDIDLSTTFLSRRLAAPLLISSMTGGPERARNINIELARAAQSLRVAFAVGSQRVALEAESAHGFGPELRAAAPDIPILANFGAAQLKAFGPNMAQRAIDMIGADALIVHCNPLQEAVQEGGDTDWTGLLAALERLQASLSLPVIVKEVGAGISGDTARRLWDAGIRIIDVAGAGGTSWAAVEAARATSDRTRAVARAFRDWGIPTAQALVDVRRACPEATVIASGGVRDGIDVAKCLRLGADLVGQAAAVLPSALAGADAVAAHLASVIDQLRVACFCTGSSNLAALRQARLLPPVSPASLIGD